MVSKQHSLQHSLKSDAFNSLDTRVTALENKTPVLLYSETVLNIELTRVDGKSSKNLPLNYSSIYNTIRNGNIVYSKLIFVWSGYATLTNYKSSITPRAGIAYIGSESYQNAGIEMNSTDSIFGKIYYHFRSLDSNIYTSSDYEIDYVQYYSYDRFDVSINPSNIYGRLLQFNGSSSSYSGSMKVYHSYTGNDSVVNKIKLDIYGLDPFTTI